MLGVRAFISTQGLSIRSKEYSKSVNEGFSSFEMVYETSSASIPYTENVRSLLLDSV